MNNKNSIISYLRPKLASSINFVDRIYKSIYFGDLFISRIPFVLEKNIQKTSKFHESELERLKTKEIINVVFLLQNPSVWKYDKLYWLFEKDDRFEPIVVICPFNLKINSNKKEIKRLMQNTEEFVIKKKYNYMSSYDKENNKFLEIKNILKPDIIFFSKPYKDTHPKYHIYNLKNYLTCYVPYGIPGVNLYKLNFNLAFHNLIWKFFLETDFHKKISEQHSYCKGKNTCVSGSLGTEEFLDNNRIPKDVWKKQDRQKKRIIWAPHHTISDLFNFSNFLNYYNFMLEIAEKYKNEIQIAFKPHPILKFKLYNIWGEEKTDNYYKTWQELENTQIEEADYIDLFLTSDAMIHDCASFTIEYLYTKKACLFQVKNDKITEYHNEFGKKAFELHYHAYNETDIEDFINNIINNTGDILENKRKDFFNEYLYPKDNIMPSQKILNIIKNEIGI